jgi:hypothetical protein
MEKGHILLLNKDYAEQYAVGEKGKLIVKEIELKNPFVATAYEVEQLGYSARQQAMREEKSIKEQLEIASWAIRRVLEEKGHDGIVIKEAGEIIIFNNKVGHENSKK